MNRILGTLVFICLMLGWNQVVELQSQEKHAVVVGVETYDTSIFQNLKYAEDDAEGISSALMRLGFDVILMTSNANSTSLKPNSPDKILTAIRNKARGLGKYDTLIVTLSGHGVQLAGDKLINGVKELYFCPEDANPDDVNSLVKLSEIAELIKQCEATRKLLIVDACRNDVLSKAGDKSGTAKKIDLGGVFENEQTFPKGTYTLLSCSSGEKSWEHPDLEHSVFSNYVIEYLSGNASQNLYDGGQLDLDGLIYYAKSKTKKFVSAELGGQSQTPVQRGTSDAASWLLGSLWFENDLGMRFSFIPPGQFMMGSEDSPEEIAREFPYEFASEDRWEATYPRHQVRITKPFYMGIHEVTIGQFRKFVEETGYQTGVERGQKFDNPFEIGTYEKTKSWNDSGHAKATDLFPVTIVSWEDAQAFCKWLGKKEGQTVRLPTQAEWEYACRAGSESRFFFGDNVELLARYANVPTRRATHQINFEFQGNGTSIKSCIQVADFVEKISIFGGSNGQPIYFETDNNEHRNRTRFIVVENQSTIAGINVQTETDSHVLASGNEVKVTPIEAVPSNTVCFEYFTETQDGEPDWVVAGILRPGETLNAYRQDGRWNMDRIGWLNPIWLNTQKIEVFNTDASSTLHVRIREQVFKIAPQTAKTLDCIDEKLSQRINTPDLYEDLAPVGQYEPNAFGIFDMHGNVWEWCQDGFDLDYSKRVERDPVGSRISDLYAIRGACYI